MKYLLLTFILMFLLIVAYRYLVRRSAPPPRLAQPTSIKAVYLVHDQGVLDKDELDRHPEVKVTDSFDTFKEYATQRVAFWIDKKALTLGERTWLYKLPPGTYPIVIVGYSDTKYVLCEVLGPCFGGETGYIQSLDDFIRVVKDAVTTMRDRLRPGFTVIVVKRDPLHPYPGIVETIAEKGYVNSNVHVENILSITNALLNGVLPENRGAHPLFPIATPSSAF